MRVRGRGDERGAALVEFAILAPILLVLAAWVIDVGDAYFRSAAVLDSLRSAAVIGFDQGSDYEHDAHLVTVVVNEADNRRVEKLTKMVVFDATSTDEVPAQCLTRSAATAGGVAGECVIYGPSDFDQARLGTLADVFDADCAISRDRSWCASGRVDEAGWSVGLHLEAEQRALAGILPVLRNYTLTETIVVREFPREAS